MITILAYILGFFTAYLETHGFKGGGLLTATGATSLVLLRIIGGSLMQPFTSKLFSRLSNSAKPLSWLDHHLRLHPIFKYKSCPICHVTPTSVSPSNP